MITVRLIAVLIFAVSELSRFFTLSFRLFPSSELIIYSLFKKWSLELESLEVNLNPVTSRLGDLDSLSILNNFMMKLMILTNAIFGVVK